MNSPHDSRGSVARDTAAVCVASLLFVGMVVGSVLVDPAMERPDGMRPASPALEPVADPVLTRPAPVHGSVIYHS